MSKSQSRPTRRAVQQYLDGLNNGPRLEATAFAPDAVIRYPGSPSMGVEEFGAQLVGVKAALASFELATKEVFETDHGVAARWHLTAVTKTGRTVSCDGIDSWVLDPNGRIQSLDVCYDPTPLLDAIQDREAVAG